MLSGIRVIEVASWMMAPSAGVILAEWGADVIKVEDAVGGDPLRGLVSSGFFPTSDVNFMVELTNRGKRSVGINLTNSEGRDLLYRLVRDADVFVTNYLPAVRRRLGIDIEDIRAVNPKIVYCRASAVGPKGQEAERGGFDSAAFWARGGFAAVLQGENAWPAAPRSGIGDLVGGLALAGGISTALLRRERTGEAAVIDVSLLSLAMWQLAPDVTSSKLYEGVATPSFDRDSLPNPLAATYETRDGRFITLMMIQSDPDWPDLCVRLGQPQLVDDPRFHDSAARYENRRECIALLRRIFVERPLDDWCAQFETFKGVWSAVRTPREIHDDPQVRANAYMSALETMSGAVISVPANPVRFDETAPSIGGAPEHGQHTEEVLLELGLGFDEISAHKASGAIL